MKKVNLLNAALLLGAVVTVSTLSSCGDTEEVTNLENQASLAWAPVTVQVNEFSMSVDDIPDSPTRATETPAEYENVGAITLSFYTSDGTLVCSSTQLKSDESTFDTFGEFSLLVPIGSYTMVVIARDVLDGDEFTLTSPTAAGYTSEKVRETFSNTQTVAVSSTAALNLSVTLTRPVTVLSVESTDVRPVGVSKIRTTFGKGGKTFSPSTGLATVNTGFSTINIPSAAEGEKIGYRNFAFLATDEQTMDVTLEVLDADDEVIISKVISDVPLKRNRRTALKGPVFTPSASSASFTLDTSWPSAVTVNFD